MKRILLAWWLTAAAAFAEQTFPRPGWEDRPNPLASPDAVVGGEISAYAAQYPKSFNYYLDNNVFCAELFSTLYDSLLSTDPLTAEYEPGLASRWAISDDKLTFTFWLDKDARWSDGQPITAADVKWTFDAIRDPKNLTGPHKVALEKINSPEIVDERQVRFTAQEVHWRNLDALGSLLILPRHVYEQMDFNKLNFEFPVVSGLYRLGEIKEGVFVRLERRDDWWGRARRRAAHVGNFQTITHRFYADNENAFEAFKKGLFDVYPVYTARIWVNETAGARFANNWIIKQKIQNHNPVGFQGFAMNMRRPPFDDLRVRQALAHLLDREKMNRTIMYNQYFLQRSYFEDLYSKEHPCRNPVFEFNKDKARALLQEAGWKANPKTGILERDGKPFTFKFLTRDPSTDKFLAIYGEDLKDVGIELVIDQKDWAAWSKDMDEFNFDMTWAAWSGSLFKDPESMWASREADRPGGNNITGFKNAEVDALIERQRAIFDIEQRNEICRAIDAIATREVPYILLWNINYVRLLYWNKFGTPPTVLSKFGDERAAYSLWWYDEDSAADLADAQARDARLPPRPAMVQFDEVFGK